MTDEPSNVVPFPRKPEVYRITMGRPAHVSACFETLTGLIDRMRAQVRAGERERMAGLRLEVAFDFETGWIELRWLPRRGGGGRAA